MHPSIINHRPCAISLNHPFIPPPPRLCAPAHPLNHPPRYHSRYQTHLRLIHLFSLPTYSLALTMSLKSTTSPCQSSDMTCPGSDIGPQSSQTAPVSKPNRSSPSTISKSALRRGKRKPRPSNPEPPSEPQGPTSDAKPNLNHHPKSGKTNPTVVPGLHRVPDSPMSPAIPGTPVTPVTLPLPDAAIDTAKTEPPHDVKAEPAQDKDMGGSMDMSSLGEDLPQATTTINASTATTTPTTATPPNSSPDRSPPPRPGRLAPVVNHNRAVMIIDGGKEVDLSVKGEFVFKHTLTTILRAAGKVDAQKAWEDKGGKGPPPSPESQSMAPPPMPVVSSNAMPARRPRGRRNSSSSAAAMAVGVSGGSSQMIAPAPHTLSDAELQKMGLAYVRGPTAAPQQPVEGFPVRGRRGKGKVAKKQVKRKRGMFPCNLCCSVFGLRHNLLRHVRTIHEGKRPFKCTVPGCKASFVQRFDLQTHQTSVHAKRKDFKCPHCARAFSQRSNLLTHLRCTHNSNTP